jgi:uncharacterized protein
MKSPLIIPVDRLHKEPLHLQLELEPVALDLIDEEFEFMAPVRIDLTFHLVGKDILAQGTLETLAQTPCVRCLVPTPVPLRVEVTETWFFKTAAQQAEDLATSEHLPLDRVFCGEEVDVTDDLRELIMSELPERTYCREECKGLCAGCGANLNSEPCACQSPEQLAAAQERIPEWKKALKNIKLG